MARYHVTPVLSYTYPAQVLWGKGSPPSSIKDISGLTIRVSTADEGYLLQKLVANPATLTTAEVTTGLQRGVVNAVTTAAFAGYKWGSLLDWGYLQPINVTPGFVMVNSKALASLPSGVRATFLKVAKKWQQQMLLKVPKEESIYTKAMANHFGIQVIHGTAADTATIKTLMAPYIQKWVRGHNMGQLFRSLTKALATAKK